MIEIVTLNILIVINNIIDCKLNIVLIEFNKNTPNIISIYGYKYPYKLIFLEIRSYLEKILTNLSKSYNFSSPKITKVNPI